MKDLIPMLKNSSRLVAVAAAAALILALTDGITRGPIAAYQKQKKLTARNAVLPAAQYSIHTNAGLLRYAGAEYTNRKELSRGIAFPKTSFSKIYYRAYSKQTNCIGFVYQMTALEGYGGPIEMTVGIRLLTNALGGTPVVSDYRVIQSAETPGLGKAAEDKLHGFFMNKNKKIADFTSNPKTDAISGATVTSAAIKDALYAAVLASEFKIREEYVNLNLPEIWLKILPYTQTLVRLPWTNSGGALRELYEAKYFYQSLGLVGKLYFQADGKKYLAVAGYQPVFNRIYTLAVFEMKYDAATPFVPVPVDLRPYIFATPELLAMRKPQSQVSGSGSFPLKLYSATVESIEALKKAGRWK